MVSSLSWGVSTGGGNIAGSYVHFGKTRLYRFIQTVSWALIIPSKTHFMCPCVPKGSRIWPLLPYLVKSSTGLNQWISSLLKNMYRRTTDRLLILKGCPLSTIFLAKILSGSTLYNDPVPTRVWQLVCLSCVNTRTGAGGNIMGAYSVATNAPSWGIKRSSLCLSPDVCWE